MQTAQVFPDELRSNSVNPQVMRQKQILKKGLIRYFYQVLMFMKYLRDLFI